MQQQGYAAQSCCCSYPNCSVCRPQTSNPHYPQTASPTTVHHYNWPSVLEQMGNDPQSKLADAINRLCDLIEKS